MKSFADLTDDQRSLAIEESLRRVVRAVTEGGLRFNDLANGNDLQNRIDRARIQAEEEPVAWAHLVLESCHGDLVKLAVMSAQDAVYVEGETVISLSDL